MLRDITIGQHFPGDSLVHKFDPRMKLVLTIVYIILLFAASNPLGLTLSLVFLVAMYGVAKIPFKLITKSLKPILPIILFTAVLNLFFVSGEGEPLVHFWVLNIYAEGLRYAILMAVRVMALIAGTSLLTYTTSPIVLTDAIEQLLKPLGRLHFPVHELAMMMSIALRFIPTLIEETDKIMNAQKARGAQLDTGKMLDRVKALVPVLIPLFISAFRRADELTVQGILSVASLVQLWRTQMLPVLYLVILAALLLLLWLLVKRCQEYNVPGKVSRVFSVFLCACMALGCVWAQQGLTALDNMTNGLLTGAEANKITKEPFVIYLSGVDTRG